MPKPTTKTKRPKNAPKTSKRAPTSGSFKPGNKAAVKVDKPDQLDPEDFDYKAYAEKIVKGLMKSRDKDYQKVGVTIAEKLGLLGDGEDTGKKLLEIYKQALVQVEEMRGMTKGLGLEKKG